MRILMNVRIPHEPFNTLVRKGKAREIIQKIIKESKCQVVCFCKENEEDMSYAAGNRLTPTSDTAVL